MEHLKVLVNNESESREAQELFSELGYMKGECLHAHYPKLVVTSDSGSSCWYSAGANIKAFSNYKEITLLNLRDMVILKRNDISDANHIDSSNYYWHAASDKKHYRYQGNLWVYQPYVDCLDLKPIEKSTKEYLTKMQDGSYKLVPSNMSDGDIKIPNGADLYVYFEEYNQSNFYKGDFDAVWQDDSGWDYDMDDYKSYCEKEGVVLWSRHGDSYITQETDIESVVNDVDNKDFAKYVSHWIERWLNGEKIQYHLGNFVEGKSQWHKLTESSLKYIQHKDIKFQVAPKYVKINGIEFKSLESLIKHVKINYDLEG